MLKSLISPIQTWLLSRGQCVGCGMPLAKGESETRNKDEDQVTCKCGRIYIYTNSDKKYRRALLTEVK